MKIGSLLAENGIEEIKFPCCLADIIGKRKIALNIIALGDVGRTLLVGLKLMGGDVIESIGIFDPAPGKAAWLAAETGQIRMPLGDSFPKVREISEDEITDCDAMVFCASKGVPPLGAEGDVRMMQLAGNGAIIRDLGEKIKAAGFGGMIFVMSDPVDNLCNILLEASGVSPGNIRGLGLGVMNARACYFAERDERFASYIKSGRVYGAHGEGTIAANSVEEYDDDLSRELTKLVKTANLEIRETGNKPYIGPAMSSGAISICEALRGNWSYGSVYLGDGKRGTYFGLLSRLKDGAWEYEDAEILDALYERIKESYLELCESRS